MERSDEAYARSLPSALSQDAHHQPGADRRRMTLRLGGKGSPDLHRRHRPSADVPPRDDIPCAFALAPRLLLTRGRRKGEVTCVRSFRWRR